MKIKNALIIIDLQKDFIDGSIIIPHTSAIIDKINRIRKYFNIVISTKMINTSLETEKPNRITISDINFYCVEDTEGSKLVIDNEFIFTRKDDLNAFRSKMDNKFLDDFLKENEVTDLYLCGVTGDYSIKYFILDAKEKYNLHLIIDAVKNFTNMDYLTRFLLSNKIDIITCKDIKLLTNMRTVEDKVFYRSI